MNIKFFIPIVLTAILYGSYDALIKLSSPNIEASLGAVVVQIFSVLMISILILYRLLILKAYQIKITPQGLFYSSVAGALIGLALISLFFLLAKKEIKVAIAQPMILLLRNLTLVLISILFLKESLSPIKLLGICLSLISLYFLAS